MADINAGRGVNGAGGLELVGIAPNPAISPWVLAVGASDTLGTPDVAHDPLAPFSNRGTDDRRVERAGPRCRHGVLSRPRQRPG